MSCFHSARTHISRSLALCVCSVSIQRAAAGREEQRFNSAKHRYYFACFSNFTWCKYSRNHSTAIVIILCVFDFIKRGLYYQDFCEDYILEGRAGYLVNGSRFNHNFILIPSSDNRNSKIYKLKKFYGEFSCIKIQYMCTERQTNAIINNIGYVHFACSEVSCPVLQKCKPVCVSKLLCAKKEK